MDSTQTKRYITAICTLIEHINKAELTKYGYKVILNYLDECPENGHSEKARYAIEKYICKNIPTLEAVRQKHDAGMRLDEVDHLILKIEYEAEKLDHMA